MHASKKTFLNNIHFSFSLVWIATQNHSDVISDQIAVPFLPVNPSYSSTRNQGRQKLALFNAQEFSTLVLDIIVDARRREMGSQLDLRDGIEHFSDKQL